MFLDTLCLLFSLFPEPSETPGLWGHKNSSRDQALLTSSQWLQGSTLLHLVGISQPAGRLDPAVTTDPQIWSSVEHFSLLFKIDLHLCFLPELALHLWRRPRCQRPRPSHTDVKKHQIYFHHAWYSLLLTEPRNHLVDGWARQGAGYSRMVMRWRGNLLGVEESVEEKQRENERGRGEKGDRERG